jgi:hypothetical protein
MDPHCLEASYPYPSYLLYINKWNTSKERKRKHNTIKNGNKKNYLTVNKRNKTTKILTGSFGELLGFRFFCQVPPQKHSQ